MRYLLRIIGVTLPFVVIAPLLVGCPKKPPPPMKVEPATGTQPTSNPEAGGPVLSGPEAQAMKAKGGGTPGAGPSQGGGRATTE